MILIQQVKDNKETIIQRLAKRGKDFTKLIDQILTEDEKRRETQKILDETLAKANQIAKEIGTLFQKGEKGKANQAKEESSQLKEKSKIFQEQLKNHEQELFNLLVQVPNVPHESVPQGNSEDDNEIMRTFGVAEKKENALPHWELATKYDIIDFEAGNKITGSGFPVYRGKGAKLQRALISFFLDKAIAKGYLEHQPPLMVNEDTGFGTGQLPDKEGQMYHVEKDNLYLIPTAEVPLTNLYRDVILNESDLPVKLTAFTPCFRREAGSYGKNVRGLNRLHQFEKVEIVEIEHPDRSYEKLEDMVKHVESLLQDLGLTYRVLKLCGGDLGFAAAMTYDLEVYSAAQNRWLEVSSVSNFETFQANRMKLRFKDENKKNRILHTLNGSALALPRIVAALLENYQRNEGILIPEVLQPYTSFDIIN